MSNDKPKRKIPDWGLSKHIEIVNEEPKKKVIKRKSIPAPPKPPKYTEEELGLPVIKSPGFKSGIPTVAMSIHDLRTYGELIKEIETKQIDEHLESFGYAVTNYNNLKSRMMYRDGQLQFTNKNINALEKLNKKLIEKLGNDESLEFQEEIKQIIESIKVK